MSTFQVHTVDSAPQGSKEALNGLRKNIGMIPNLAASMAESPELLRGFLAVREILYRGSFTPAEVQVLASPTLSRTAAATGWRCTPLLRSK